VLKQQVLDLSRVDIEAADEEDVLLAPCDREPAAGGHGSQVAGMQPAVRVDRRGRGGGVIEVSVHDAVAAHEHLPVGRDHHLGARARQPSRGRDVLRRVTAPGQRDRAAGLGEPVAGQHGLEGQLAADALDERDRDIGRADDGGPQRRQVPLALRGGGQQRVVERRRAGQHRDPFPLHQAEDGGPVVHRHRQHRRAGDEGRDQPRLVAEDVEERVHDQVPVAPLEADELAPLHPRPDRPRVAHHDALGPPGGAGSEEDSAGVRPADHGLIGGAGIQEARRQVDDRHARLRSVAGVVGAEEVLLDEGELGPAAADHLGRLGGLVPGVDRDQHAAGGQQAEGCDDPPGAVGCPQGHPVTCPDPGLPERAGGHEDPAGQFPEREAGRPVDDGLVVPEAVSGRPDQLRDGLPAHAVPPTRSGFPGRSLTAVPPRSLRVPRPLAHALQCSFAY
jgi:hypothetical protein